MRLPLARQRTRHPTSAQERSFMMLSPSEFFILGRIMAAWRTGSETNPRPSWARSLMDTVNHMFYEFGLEYVVGAEAWADVKRRDAPDDTAWKHIEGSRADATPLGHIDDFLPGVPTLALGVSPSVPGRLFVRRIDGDVCAWVVERPRAGLYLAIMRWLRPWAAVSPHLWLVTSERTWPAAVEEWRTLPEFVGVHPHTAFEDDRAEGVADAAAEAARGAGCEHEFRLGGLAAEVEMRAWALADQAGQADALRRYRNESLGDPDEILWNLLARAHEAMRCPAVEQVCAADDGAIGFYHAARRALSAAQRPLGGPPAIRLAIDEAHLRTVQASTYLYGTFRPR
ncbi:MAG: hypothetical protein ACKO4T_01040 [Planctomycetaceae bacterium]